MQRMAIEGKIPDLFYPQMVERVTQQPINTPVPMLQVTNPDPPSPPELIRPASPTPFDMYTPTIEVLPVPAPQVRDYTLATLADCTTSPPPLKMTTTAPHHSSPPSHCLDEANPPRLYGTAVSTAGRLAIGTTNAPPLTPDAMKWASA